MYAKEPIDKAEYMTCNLFGKALMLFSIGVGYKRPLPEYFYSLCTCNSVSIFSLNFPVLGILMVKESIDTGEYMNCNLTGINYNRKVSIHGTFVTSLQFSPNILMLCNFLSKNRLIKTSARLVT